MQKPPGDRHSKFEILHSKFLIHSVPVLASFPPLSPTTLLMSSLSSLPGLKYGIFFEGTSTFSPVFGFRPVRDFRLRSRKLPKPRSSIFCPLRSDSTMESKTMLTIVSACFLVSCTTLATSSTSSALVITPALFSPTDDWVSSSRSTTDTSSLHYHLYRNRGARRLRIRSIGDCDSEPSEKRSSNPGFFFLG